MVVIIVPKDIYKKAKVWCYSCDRHLVTLATKCPICNTFCEHKGKKRLNKAELKADYYKGVFDEC